MKMEENSFGVRVQIGDMVFRFEKDDSITIFPFTPPGKLPEFSYRATPQSIHRMLKAYCLITMEGEQG